MIPLKNGNDYYKKMLELQERLRRSEEERIRLEERFSLLEHESRSRHETCINRLRMRYIEFLEEQQARDERNHRLLGALDRVDTSLALMSAKTDRLGALRKQYEASILSSYNNRTNGSVTGDSGVASQNDEKQRRSNCLNAGNKNARFLADRGSSLAFGANKSATTGRMHSLNQMGSDPCYANFSVPRYENSQPISSPISSVRFPQTARLSRKNSEQLVSSNNSLNPRKSHHTRSSIDRETVPQTSAYEYRSPSRFASEYSMKKPETKSYLSEWREGSTGTVIRDLANSGAYNSYTMPSRTFNETSGYSPAFQPDRLAAARLSAANLSRNESEKPINLNTNYSSFSKDLSIPGKQNNYTKVTDMLREELGDEEDYLGSAVENELERYISKIRNLHRDADPQSVEDVDPEQNTSGDLLNVTLSDDGVDLSAEEKPRIRLPQNLENVLEIADDLAKRTATGDNNISNDIRRENVEKLTAAGAEGSLGDRNSTNVANQFTSVNPRSGDDVSNEKLSLRAKNGISAEIAKDGAELATRQRRNIEDIAKISRNRRDNRVGSVDSSGINGNEKYRNSEELEILEENENEVIEDSGELLMENYPGIEKLENEYKVLVGEVRETEDHLRDIYEELEPWNLSALERRVQEIILKDEAQDDYVGEMEDPAKVPQQQEPLNIQSKDSKAEFERNELIAVSAGNSNELMESLSEIKNEEMRNRKEKEYESSEIPEDINRLSEEYREKSGETVQEIANRTNSDPTDYGVTGEEENYVEPEKSFVQNEYPANTDQQYEYTSETYQGNPNEYQNYDPNGVQYPEDPNGQYSYDQRYPTDYNGDSNVPQRYPEDSNLQQQYSEDSNLQQQYPEDPNLQQQYPEDPNLQQQYSEDPNLQQQYSEDPNLQQQYPEDPNLQQQYSEDPNLQQQYPEDPNLQQQYPEDPNLQQQYSEDPNLQQQYSEDPNLQQQYSEDPNLQQQYPEDPNLQQQYPEDPNLQQQYPEDPNLQQQYPEDSNLQQQYPEDPNLQQQYPEDPNLQQQYPEDPNLQQQYSEDPNLQQQYSEDPNLQQQYPEDPNLQQQYSEDPNLQQQYSEDPNLQQQYSEDPNLQQQYEKNPNESADYLGNADYIAAAEPNEQYVNNESNYEGYSVDPSQEYSTNVDQQEYQQNENYPQGDDVAYPVSSADYVYPESQQYANMEVYEPNAQPIADGQEYYEGTEASKVYESQNNFDGQPDKGSGDEIRGNETNETVTIAQKNAQLKDEKNTKKSKDVIKSLLDSDTESTIEKNVSNTESDFDFN